MPVDPPGILPSESEFRGQAEALLSEIRAKPDNVRTIRQLFNNLIDPRNLLNTNSWEHRYWEQYANRLKEVLPFSAMNLFFDLCSSLTSAALAPSESANQEGGDRWVHKGMPLVWIADIFGSLGFNWHARRYYLHTLVEDSIWKKGLLADNEQGIAFRLRDILGLSDQMVATLSGEIYECWMGLPAWKRPFPESVLLERSFHLGLGNPSTEESGHYYINRLFLERAIKHAASDPTGREFETLAALLLAGVPGLTPIKRAPTPSTDHDVFVRVSGFLGDFRDLIGRYFICECKNWQNSVNFTTIAKFIQVLDSSKCSFGMIFSKQGVSGDRDKDERYAARELLKAYQARGTTVLVVDDSDIARVLAGESFLEIMQHKYERVRLDLS